MNGILKSLFGWGALWVCGAVAWVVIVSVCAVLAGRGIGTALNVPMVAAWGSALLISILVIALGKTVAWKWMLAESGARWVLLLIMSVVQLATFVIEALYVFVLLNR